MCAILRDWGLDSRGCLKGGILTRMSLRGDGPRGVGNLVIPIIPLYSLNFPKVP